MPDNPQNVDQLRERLRTLGYLDAPVDRYVLGSGRGRAGTARFAVGAGLRVGLLSGVLLGMSAAIALAARAPGFVSSRRDAVVLAVMLSALFALAAAAAVTATALAASWYARRAGGITRSRARMVAATAGIIVALACTAYLTLWWTAAQNLFTSLAFGWNAAALALAAAVALLLAHAVSVVILAALVRSTASADIPAGGVLSSRGFLVTFGILLFAGSAALLATGAGRRVSGQAVPITVVPTGYALRVIAIDGFDVGQDLTADMPALSRLKAGATVPFRSDPSDMPDPARDWTTIATGRPPDVHGIAALQARRALGIEGRLPAASGGVMRSVLDAADLLRLTTPAVASGQERRVAAFWEVAAAAGLRISVVNWWATWPAPEGDDMIVSDRALLRLDAGGALDAEIAPSRLYELLRGRWAAMRASAADRAGTAFAEVANPELRRVLVRSAELDILVAALGRMNSEPAPLDLRIVYLPGLDIAQYNLLQASGAASVSAMSERVAGIQRYYRFLDTLVAELLPASRSHIDAVILWPGRVGGRQGAMLLSGPPIKPGTFDCEDCGEPGPAATILYLLGLPIASNLMFGPVTDAVADDFRARYPARSIPNYDAARMRRSVRTGQPLDAEALERLRSLGYIR
jgi:hypothetical protein